MNTTIKKLISENFNLNVNDLKVDEPVSVENFNMGIKAFNESTKKVEYAKIINVIYRGEKDCIKLKFKGRPQFEEPVAKKHMYAIAYDHNGTPSFTYAEDLRVGSKILSEVSQEEIEEIQTCGKIKTFDLTTEFGNYFTNGILSHNSYGYLPAVTGGYSPPFYATTRNRVTKIENIEKNGEVIGIHMRVRNYKNKGGVPFRDAEMDFYFDQGFNSDNEYADFLIKFGVFKQGGAWLSSEKYNVKLNGKAKLQEWLQEHPTEYAEMKEFVNQKLLGFSEELDGNNVDPMTTEDGKVMESRPVKGELENLAEQALEA